MGCRALTLGVVALIALAGCGRGGDERAARATVERFETAIEARDGAGACDELSEETASKLESSEKKPCEQAILAVELTPAGEVVDTSVWVSGGQIELNGDTVFLDETSQGWKVSAAGCEPTAPEAPYDCELEG